MWKLYKRRRVTMKLQRIKKVPKLKMKWNRLNRMKGKSTILLMLSLMVLKKSRNLYLENKSSKDEFLEVQI